MKTLTTPVNIANNAANIIKWQVLRAIDHDDSTPPWMEVVVSVLVGGAKPYPSAGASFTLVAFDSTPSLILDVNPSPLSAIDQLYTHSVQLAGTAYTTLAAANTGTKSASRLAVEAACLTTGLVAAALTGT